MQYCDNPYWSQRLTQHHGWPDAAFIQYFQKVQNKLFTKPNMQRHRCRKDKESISFLGRFHPQEQLRCSVCKISGNVGSQSTSQSRLRIGGSLVPWVCTARCPVCSFVHTKSATGTLHTFAQFRLASLANSSHGFVVWDPRPPAPSADEPSMRPLQKNDDLSQTV